MKVSIITPINLDKSTLENRCIKSIASQTNKNFEWVLVFDGQSAIPEDISILGKVNARWAMTGKNYGPSVARNIGFEISDGDVITYLDSDDELSPNRVQDIIEIFSGTTRKLVFSDYMIREPEFEHVFSHLHYKHSLGFVSDFDYVHTLLQKQNISIPMGVAHTRDIFKLEGGFQRGIVCGEDGILWRRMMDDLFPEAVYLSNVYAGTYYVNPSGQSRTQKRFEMGGFAFDGSKGDNGKYLDKDWYATFNSVNLFDRGE